MSIRDTIRKLTPKVLLHFFRSWKKKVKNKRLSAAKRKGNEYTKADLIHDFQSIGIQQGDVLLVHSSLSSLGYVENGPKDVVDALLEVVGTEGHLLMPNSPNASFQLEYVKSLTEFDVNNSPSALGAISECFRKYPNAIRSAHPTEPVSCIGKNASYFVDDHFGSSTPYASNSPFYKVSEQQGKILYLGVTLDNAGTNLHTLEDAVDNFPYPVYHDELFNVSVRFSDGRLASVSTKVHNPEQSKLRRCDQLLPLFEREGVLQRVKVLNADALLFDAKGMFDVMLNAFHEKGVTMYTPNGR